MKIIIKYVCCSLLLLLAYIFFVPQNYKAAVFRPLEEIAYWNLSTGSRIGYQQLTAQGRRKETPIIYLNGGPGAAIHQGKVDMLRPFTKSGYDVYVYDQIGSGHSDRLDDISEYTVQRHKKDLAEIIKTINAEKVILIGQSWGAVLATFFVVDYPKQVAKMIFTGPGPIFPVNYSLANTSAPDSFQLKAPLVSNQDGNKKVYGMRAKLIRWWARTFAAKLATDQEVDLFFSHLNEELSKSTYCDTTFMNAPTGGGGYYAHIMTMKSLNTVTNPRGRLQKIELPVLIMKGQCDNQKWGFTEEYLSCFPSSRLVIIPNAGHSIYAAQPNLYLEKISHFLEQKNSLNGD